MADHAKHVDDRNEEIRTVTVGPVSAGHGDPQGDYDESCTEFVGARNKITVLAAYMPLGSQVKQIRLYSVGAKGGTWHENAPCADVEWARWLQPKQYNSGEYLRVDGKFKNWSHDRTRNIKMEVDYVPPPGAE